MVRLLTAAAILVMAGLQLGSIVQESATYDEGVHLTAGYRYWKTRKFNLNMEHPPFQKLLSAAPLLAAGPPLPADPKLLVDQTEYARTFLYEGPMDAGRMLLMGRAPTMVLSLFLLVAVAWAGRRFFGAPAALAAVWLCALDPNLIAHGRYVTNDLASTLFYFLTVVLWISYLEAPSWPKAIGTGAALGLALATKFSMLLLPLVLLVILAFRWRTAVRSLAGLAVVCIVGLTVMLATYGPESWRTIRGRTIDASPETIAGVKFPPHNYVTGLRTLMDHNREGHPSYLLGEKGEQGWWYYFPVVFAVKSPTALLILVALSVWRFRSFRALALLAAALIYFGVTMTSHINLGVRHLLPIYPFLYLLGASVLWPRWRAAVLALILLQAGETLAVYPDYLGYFNIPAGGPKAGPKYLLDSNIDWGQDLKKLKVYMDRNHTSKVCLEYFGTAMPKYYGIEQEYLPRTWDKDELERLDCLGAISVTLLKDLYIKPGSFEWLRQRSPIGVVGSSIYLYDLRKRP